MAICTFCGKKFEYSGKMIVLNSGRIDYFCSLKCEKSTNMGRKPRKFKWTVMGSAKKQVK